MRSVPQVKTLWDQADQWRTRSDDTDEVLAVIIAEYVDDSDEHTASGLARDLGVSQSALDRKLQRGRKLRLTDVIDTDPEE